VEAEGKKKQTSAKKKREFEFERVTGPAA